MNRAIILLGSNINKERNLPAAVRLLAEAGRVKAVSRVYETAPVGLLEQPDFFNAAVLLETTLSAAELKSGLLAGIERVLRRERHADKNAPRTIDLDIVLYNDEAFDYACDDGRVRHVPDPDLLRFLHVALPVAELVPDLLHPETGESMREIAGRLAAEAEQAGSPSVRPRPDIVLSAQAA